MPIAHQSDATCPNCDGTDTWEFTKADETTRRIECDDCRTEWSLPA